MRIFSKPMLGIFIVFMVVFLLPLPALASEAQFMVGNNKYAVDDVVNEMDAAPFMEEGRVFVPVRYIAMVCGVSGKNINYDGATQCVALVTDEGQEVKLTVGEKEILVAGVAVPMDVAPKNINGRIYLPVRYIAEALQRTVDWDPNYAIATIQILDYRQMALEKIKAKEYQAAINLCDKVTEMSPNSSSSHVIRGVAYFYQTQFEDAILAYDKAIQINPDNAWAYMCRAEARWPLYLKQTEKTIEIDTIIDDVSKAIEASEDAVFYFRRAGLYNFTGEYEKAIADCDKAISLDVQMKDAYYRRAIAVYLKDGQAAFKVQVADVLQRFPGDDWAIRVTNLMAGGAKLQMDVTDW